MANCVNDALHTYFQLVALRDALPSIGKLLSVPAKLLDSKLQSPLAESDAGACLSLAALKAAQYTFDGQPNTKDEVARCMAKAATLLQRDSAVSSIHKAAILCNLGVLAAEVVRDEAAATSYFDQSVTLDDSLGVAWAYLGLRPGHAHNISRCLVKGIRLLERDDDWSPLRSRAFEKLSNLLSDSPDAKLLLGRAGNCSADQMLFEAALLDPSRDSVWKTLKCWCHREPVRAPPSVGRAGITYDLDAISSFERLKRCPRPLQPSWVLVSYPLSADFYRKRQVSPNLGNLTALLRRERDSMRARDQAEVSKLLFHIDRGICWLDEEPDAAPNDMVRFQLAGPPLPLNVVDAPKRFYKTNLDDGRAVDVEVRSGTLSEGQPLAPQELRCLLSIGHRNIQRLEGYFCDQAERRTLLALEYTDPNGFKTPTLPEDGTRFSLELLSAVTFLHANGFAHGNLRNGLQFGVMEDDGLHLKLGCLGGVVALADSPGVQARDLQDVLGILKEFLPSGGRALSSAWTDYQTLLERAEQLTTDLAYRLMDALDSSRLFSVQMADGSRTLSVRRDFATPDEDPISRMQREFKRLRRVGPEATYLTFEGCSVTNEHLLPYVKYLDSLTDVTIVSCPNVTDAVLPSFRRSGASYDTSIRILSLRQCSKVGDKGLGTLLWHCPQLVFLDLTGTSIKASGAAFTTLFQMADANRLSSLSEFHFQAYRSDFDEATIVAVIRKIGKNLTRLGLWRCIKGLADAIRECCPHLVELLLAVWEQDSEEAAQVRMLKQLKNIGRGSD